MLHDLNLPGPGLPSWLQTSSVATLVTPPSRLDDCDHTWWSNFSAAQYMNASMWTGLKEALHCMQELSMIVSFSWNTQVHLGLRQWFSIILWSTDPVFHHCLIQNLGVIIVTRGNIFRRSWLRFSVVSRISFHYLHWSSLGRFAAGILLGYLLIFSWKICWSSLGRFADLLLEDFLIFSWKICSPFDNGIQLLWWRWQCPPCSKEQTRPQDATSFSRLSRLASWISRLASWNPLSVS